MKNPFNILANSYRNRHDPEQARIFMGGVWYILLGLLIAAALGVMVYGWMALWNIQHDSGRGARSVAPESVTRTELTAALELTRAREARYEFLRSNPPRIANPAR